MKRFILFITCMFFMHVTFAQIGIGTTSPNDNAILDVYSTNKGLLIPRLTLTSTTSFSPLSAHVAGMLVYNTATVGDVTPGFYYNTGSTWSRVSSGSGGSNLYSADGALTANRTVNFDGNSFLDFTHNSSGDSTFMRLVNDYNSGFVPTYSYGDDMVSGIEFGNNSDGSHLLIGLNSEPSAELSTDGAMYLRSSTGGEVTVNSGVRLFSSSGDINLNAINTGVVRLTSSARDYGFSAGTLPIVDTTEESSYILGMTSTNGYWRSLDIDTFINNKVDITVDANSNHFTSDAINNVTTGVDNLIFGEFAGGGVTTANRNVIIGDGTLTSTTSIDDDNVLIGTGVGVSSTMGRRNILMGLNTTYSGTLGDENIAIGFAASRGVMGNNNIALGLRAITGYDTPSSKGFADHNIGIGGHAGRGAGGDNNNIFIGFESGSGTWVGSDNIFIGSNTGQIGNNTTPTWAIEHRVGDNNTVLGADAFNSEKAIGDNNLFLGAETDTDGDTDSATVADNYSNSVAIGYQATITASNQIVIGRTANDIIDLNANSINTGGDVLPDTDNAHTLGSATNRWIEVYAANGTINTSDKRLKKNILKLDYGLSEILRLKPVSYHWKTNDNGTRLGFIAQDLQKVLPEVVTVSEDKNKRLGVRYSELIPVLTKALQEQQAIIEALKIQNNRLSLEVTQSTTDIETLKLELQLLKEQILGTSVEVSVLNK